LSREAPAWSRENRCFSCHNNGDAARALYQARKRGYAVPETALADTAGWLARPDRWEQELADAQFKDDRLARLQFAAALAVAAEPNDRALSQSLQRAAGRLAEDQAADGAWPMVTGVGGATTYSTPLATHLAREVLKHANAAAYREQLRRSQEWLERQEVVNVLNGAAILWALAEIDTPAAQSQRQRAIALLRRGENRSGGWGPYLVSAPEPFDTAIVLLALTALDDESLQPLVERGRTWLIQQQFASGGWPATTRPAGGDSYAQSISTTAWCLQALLVTQPTRP
jgi:hypothetical protein